MKLWTSRWANRDLARLDVVAVGISRGVPKFPVRYRYRRLPDLYPDGWMLGIKDDAQFNEAYRRKLERIGVERIAAGLQRLSDEEGGSDLALLCFEADPARCHRGQFADWWTQQTGEVVPELDCGQSHSSSAPVQDALW